jgi:acyl-[acyl carrier protein]--UDP-N-acetylglucosamine O-acyltransferase
MATKLRQYTLDANNGLTAVAYIDVPAGGSVTSVGQTFTGGLISVAGSPVTTTGTLALTVAGTSGGVPYFSGAATWASSAVLAANALVLGGGAAAAPATTTTGTGVVTALGVNVGSAGAVVLNGGALGTPASGVLTNCTGTAAGLTAGTVTTNANLTGHVTSVGNAAVLGSFTVAQLNAAISDADVATGGGTATGTNTGDQTSIVGITGTIAQFNTACTDADFATGGGTATGTNTGDQTNITGNAATVTTNANLTGDVTSVGNATTIADSTATLTLTATPDSGSLTSYSSEGYKVQVGKQVTVRASVKIVTPGTAGGGLTIGGLPLSKTMSDGFRAGTCLVREDNVTGNAYQGYVPSNSSNCVVVSLTNGAVNWSANAVYVFSISYLLP